MDSVIVKLPQFEGPIELLWALIQKNELDICQLGLKVLMEQVANSVEDEIDLGAESIGHVGNLLWIKSRALLPDVSSHEEPLDDDSNEHQNKLLQKLVEYCRFKDAATHLSLREEKTKESFVRPVPLLEGMKRNLGIEHVSLEELAAVFQIILEKAKNVCGIIEEEEWKISDKMEAIRHQLTIQSQISFQSLFQPNYTKIEVIVLFLAVLELMKLNEIRVTRNMDVVAYGK